MPTTEIGGGSVIGFVCCTCIPLILIVFITVAQIVLKILYIHSGQPLYYIIVGLDWAILALNIICCYVSFIFRKTMEDPHDQNPEKRGRISTGCLIANSLIFGMLVLFATIFPDEGKILLLVSLVWSILLCVNVIIVYGRTCRCL